MYHTGIAFLALVGAAFAANGTVQIWLPQNNEPNLIGSVVGSVGTVPANALDESTKIHRT